MLYSTTLVLLGVYAAWFGPREMTPFTGEARYRPDNWLRFEGSMAASTLSHLPAGTWRWSPTKPDSVYERVGIEVQVVEHNGGVTICAVYPTVDGRPAQCRPGASSPMNSLNNDVNIDFTVRLPKGVRFVGRTVNGQVEAKSLEADTEGHTVNGNVRLMHRRHRTGRDRERLYCRFGWKNRRFQILYGEWRHYG